MILFLCIFDQCCFSRPTMNWWSIYRTIFKQYLTPFGLRQLIIYNSILKYRFLYRVQLSGIQLVQKLQVPDPFLCFFFKLLQLWYQMKAHIFLITIVKFYNLSMFHLEDIIENVNNHGHHNEAYIAWYMQLHWTILICSCKQFHQFQGSQLDAFCP